MYIKDGPCAEKIVINVQREWSMCSEDGLCPEMMVCPQRMVHEWRRLMVHALREWYNI